MLAQEMENVHASKSVSFDLAKPDLVQIDKYLLTFVQPYFIAVLE